MTEEIIIAGFGGQGVLSMGKLLAYAGIIEEKEVSWFPSYGPEMRGGTANVTVIISDEFVSSPILNSYDSGILLNQQSLDKFESTIKPGGFLLYDVNGINNHPTRDDITIKKITAAKEAIKMASAKTFNMIVLGAYLRYKSLVSLDNIARSLKETLPSRHHHLIPVNEEALKRGWDMASD